MMSSDRNEELQRGPFPLRLLPIVLDPTKVEVHVSTIGHVDHGKTTLTAAITRVLAQANKISMYATFDQIDNAPEVRRGGITIACSEVEYTSGDRQYLHADYSGHADCMKGIITGLHPLDEAILVVSASDGPQPQTREHIRLVRQVNVPALVVFLNKVDLLEDEELLDVVELEVRELLSKYQFSDGVPIVRGSALMALESRGDLSRDDPNAKCIWELMDKVNEYTPTTSRAIDQPFLMPVEDVFGIKSRGTVATGRIERGIVKVGDNVEIVGLREVTRNVVVISVEMYQKTPDRGMAGDSVGCFLRGVERADVFRGQVLAQPGSIKPCRAFEALIYVLSKEEGGRHTPFFDGYRPCYFVRTTDIVGQVRLPYEVEQVLPGESVDITAELVEAVAMEEGTRFAIREGGRVVCVGVCTKIKNEGGRSHK